MNKDKNKITVDEIFNKNKVSFDQELIKMLETPAPNLIENNTIKDKEVVPNISKITDKSNNIQKSNLIIDNKINSN